MGDTRNDTHQHGQQVAPTTLYAKASTNGDGKVDWALGSANPPAPGKEAVVIAKDSPGRDIIIHLVPTQGLDIEFDTSDPVFAYEGTSCPPPNPKIDTDQLSVKNCSKFKLTMHDPNTRPCTIMYQMNFIGADPFDPEIRNGGGGFIL